MSVHWHLVTDQYRVDDSNLLNRSCSTPGARVLREFNIPLYCLPLSGFINGWFLNEKCIPSSQWRREWEEVKYNLYFPDCLSSNSLLSSDSHEWWGHPGAGKSNSYFSNPIKAGIVCLRKQAGRVGGRSTSGPPSGGRMRQWCPALGGTATRRRRGFVLKCKLKLDQ